MELEKVVEKFEGDFGHKDQLDRYTQMAQDLAIVATSAFRGELLKRALGITSAIVDFAHELENQE